MYACTCLMITSLYSYYMLQGAFVFKGHMIDKPLLLQAENIVKLQEAISKTQD